MVRFHWYSEDGCDCQVHPGSLQQDSEAGVLHATAEIKLPGQRAPVEATFSMPDTFLMKSEKIGLFLTLGDKSVPGNSKFVADFGSSLSKQGYVVVWQFVKVDDTRRQQEIKKTVNACVASPYAQHVQKWILVGVGSGCQVASSIFHLFEEKLKAFIFIASSLTMKTPIGSELLFKELHASAEVPVLLLHPSLVEACSKEEVIERLSTKSPQLIRYMNIPDVDQSFRTSKGKNAVHVVSAFAVSAVYEFLNVLNRGDITTCLIPSLDHLNDAPFCDSEDPMDICEMLP